MKDNDWGGLSFIRENIDNDIIRMLSVSSIYSLDMNRLVTAEAAIKMLLTTARDRNGQESSSVKKEISFILQNTDIVEIHGITHRSKINAIVFP